MPRRKSGAEGVIFAFVKNSQILAEIRNQKNRSELLIPAGIVEGIDLKADDYRKAALEREVMEEMNISVLDSAYLGWCRLKHIPLRLHIFLVNKWKGKIPQHTVENGEKHSPLVWFPLDERYFVRRAANITCRKVLRHLDGGR